MTETLMGPPTTTNVYASRVHGWRDGPDWKMHRSVGHAKAAVACSAWGSGVRGGEIWQLTPTGWVLLYSVPQGTRTAELPWKNGSKKTTEGK